MNEQIRNINQVRSILKRICFQIQIHHRIYKKLAFNSLMGGVCNGMKQAILRCDLLACSPTLRVRGQPAYQSILGGFLSFAIMSFFIVIFFQSFTQVLNRVDISAQMSSSDQTQSTNDVSDLQFSVGIQDVQLGGAARYFDIYMQQVSISSSQGGLPTTTNRQILLQPCSVDNWKDVGDHFQQQFNVFQMSKKLCVKSGYPISMKGYQGSPNYEYLTLKIKTCTNNTYESHSCKSPTQISSFMTSYLTTHDFFKVMFLIVDTRISPADQDPISKILQKKIFLSFTDTLGTKGYISFSHYSVTTDTSIMPYSDENEVTGSYIKKYATNTIGLSSDRYILIEFFKDTEELTVSRSVAKVDEMLSYVGGLFGLLWVVVAFFLGAFNQYRYELYASQAAFTLDDTGRKIKQQDFGMMTYIAYSIYDWLNVFGCAPKSWTKMKQIDQTREQICQQLDVTYLFKKIRNLQKITTCLMNENKRICTMLTREPTLQETQRQRKLLQMYTKLNPSPCQKHSSQNNKIQNNCDENSAQNFMQMNDKLNSIQEKNNPLQNQNLSCVNQLNFDQDQQYEELMNIIKDAFSSLQNQKDQLSKQIKQKIPLKIKKSFQQKRQRSKLIVQQFGGNKQFSSCQNSFINPKHK